MLCLLVHYLCPGKFVDIGKKKWCINWFTKYFFSAFTNNKILDIGLQMDSYTGIYMEQPIQNNVPMQSSSKMYKWLLTSENLWRINTRRINTGTTYITIYHVLNK